MTFPKHLSEKIQLRKTHNSLRQLKKTPDLIDFSSNDYLGFAQSEELFNSTHQYLIDRNTVLNGATGSRLLTGNHLLNTDVEAFLATTHQSDSALLFNSGYTANLGVFSTVPQRGDVILYDALCHASIRDGIQLSNARAYKFQHQDMAQLEELLKRFQKNETAVYVVTESVFSMDGDTPNLQSLAKICKTYQAYLIVDEAHAIGVFRNGLVEKLNLQNDVFARIITFGKAMGCHGAVVLGSQQLKEYLVNFCRPFIYTTGLSLHSVATIQMAYVMLNSPDGVEKRNRLKKNSTHFRSEIERLHLNFIKSHSAIHCCVIGGNDTTKQIATQLQQHGFDVRAILSPTVPKGKERLRFCLHSYNSPQEITAVLELLATFA